MEGDSTSGTSYTPESLLWGQWWPSNQLVPVGSSEDKSSTENSVYTQTDPLIDSSLYGYNADLIYHWHYVSHEINYMNPGNDYNTVIEDMSLFSVSEHGVSKEPPGQGHWHSPSIQKTSDRKISGYFSDLTSRKPTKRTPLAQQSSNRIKRIQERNRIAANKLRIKQREKQQGLKSSKQDLERIHRNLSTYVADLTLESECNYTLIQNYLIYKSGRYI
ncbi:hypothetical protein BKA59DRAFT_491461 [Fusarium tricinctum]|uniref:BZIP domain-containing protein n=1 Tax=Fusarium tricinctum TaxID=61284 RepID=A0A8K0SAU8_9HYPO|nr:hypothetical protein BKA59DRAFT_491461 [Fusarium tricinctum]